HGLHDLAENHRFCRPGALTGRINQQAARANRPKQKSKVTQGDFGKSLKETLLETVAVLGNTGLKPGVNEMTMKYAG
ncbi:MAG TPA: hypothetical protein VF988_04630, partial [Verrucomicrobiae bacterium]